MTELRPTTPVRLSMDAALAEKLTRVASTLGITKSRAVEQLVEQLDESALTAPMPVDVTIAERKHYENQ